MTALHFTASASALAQRALVACIREHGQSPLGEADVVIALGGDGFMLQVLHTQLEQRTATGRAAPVYGLNYGTLGFLMNRPLTGDTPVGLAGGLLERVATADCVTLNPLRADVTLTDGATWTRWAFNEVALRRTTAQSAALRVLVNGQERLPRLAGDGLLMATAAGSAAYNASAGGPVLPLSAAAHPLTPICPIVPRRWPGAVLPAAAHVDVHVLELPKRPVGVTADMHAVDGATSVHIVSDPTAAVTVLFDAGHDLDERLQAIQFP